mgnify:CR=1 FL=1
MINIQNQSPIDMINLAVIHGIGFNLQENKSNERLRHKPSCKVIIQDLPYPYAIKKRLSYFI